MKTFLCWLIANFHMPIIVCGIFAGAYIGEKNIIISDILADKDALKSYYILSAIFTTLISILVVVFTYKNINEIISRRFRWGNSNVKFMDFKFKYSLKQGILCFIALSILFVDISFLLAG